MGISRIHELRDIPFAQSGIYNETVLSLYSEGTIKWIMPMLSK